MRKSSVISPYWLITAITFAAGAVAAYLLLRFVPAGWLAACLVVALFVGLPAAFLLGVWFGKTEMRGFLSGFDRSLDRMMTAVDTPDAKRAAPPAPGPNILVLPPDARPDLPRITHRRARREEEDL